MYHDLELVPPSGRYASTARLGEIRRGFQNIVCMTLYNEDLPMFGESLKALIESIAAHEERSVSPALRSGRSCIAIIADGIDRIDPEVLAFLRQSELIDTGVDFEALGETVHCSRQNRGVMLRSLGWDGSEATGDIYFAVCVKGQNHGKLHSHALFFQGIADELQPRYCYQIDAGTIVDQNAVARLVDYMTDNPDVAAAASRILTAAPSLAGSTSAVWQYMDFVAQKAVVWPTEVASGYLSVIPGQFCVFRWAAIDASPGDQDGRRPIDSYLRGLNGGTPLERVMFLAEDRVFGNEIVLARNSSWRIGYCPEAEATTDACETFGELLRQRRRWQNSALAVRLWLWGRWPSYLARDDRRPMEKLRFSTAMLWQGLLTAIEIMGPAYLLFMVVMALTTSAKMPWLAVANAAIFGVTALLTVLTLDAKASRRTALCVARDVGACLSLVIMVGGTVAFLPPAAAALFLAPGILMATVIAAAFPRNRWQVLRHLPLYFLVDRSVTLVLYGYALANMHNVTWGTKGLVTESAAMQAEKGRMLRLRNIIAGAVILFNLGLIALGLHYHGVIVGSTSVVVELFSGMWLIVTVMAALAAVAATWRAANHGRLPAPAPAVAAVRRVSQGV